MIKTVLIVGASGNIGVAATITVLRSGYCVLAVVRNQASAAKLYEHMGTTENIAVVEADVISESGLAHVVTELRAGKIPWFQHVFAAGKLTHRPPLIHIYVHEAYPNANGTPQPQEDPIQHHCQILQFIVCTSILMSISRDE